MKDKLVHRGASLLKRELLRQNFTTLNVTNCRLARFEKISFEQHLTLVMMGGLQTLVLMGGGGLKVPPPFLFVKTIEKVIRLCTVLKKKLFDWQF